MKKKIKAIFTNKWLRYLILLLVFMGVISYLFWGPLFPWNPFKIGYQKIESSKATVYISDLTEKDSVVYRVDEMLREEEQFHSLNYVDDFKIFILDKDSDIRRFLPWLRSPGYSVSLSLVNVIYIGPMARKSQTGIEPILKHELSHLLIDQNTTFAKALKIHGQGWLTEGIAEYYSGRSFYGKSEFFTLAKMNDLYFTSLYEKNPLKMSTEEVKLKYAYYRYFVEFLVENYGMEKLQDYLKRYIDNPDAYKDYFVEVYAMNLDDILQKYKTSFEE